MGKSKTLNCASATIFKWYGSKLCHANRSQAVKMEKKSKKSRIDHNNVYFQASSENEKEQFSHLPLETGILSVCFLISFVQPAFTCKMVLRNWIAKAILHCLGWNRTFINSLCMLVIFSTFRTYWFIWGRIFTVASSLGEFLLCSVLFSRTLNRVC